MQPDPPSRPTEFQDANFGLKRSLRFMQRRVRRWAGGADRPRDRRRIVSGPIRRDIDSRRDDLVDPVQNFVIETNLCAGEQVVEVLHRARPQDRRGHAGMRHHETHRHMRQRQPGRLRDGNEPLDRLQVALVGHLLGNTFTRRLSGSAWPLR